jgi:hypothetical protein
MRQVQPAPLVVVEAGLFGARRIAEDEAPAGVHGEALPLTGGRARGQRQREQAEEEQGC